MSPIKIGIVGLGTVAQAVHLPVLREISDKFVVVAGCDIDAGFAHKVAERFDIPNSYGSLDQMLGAEQLDAVAVLNSDEFHFEAVLAALSAGCHVLLEKPASLSPREIDEMIKARDIANKRVMVGYMRRYAAAYSALKDMLPPREEIRHVSMRDLIGPNNYFIDQAHDILVPDSISQEAKLHRAQKAEKLLIEAIGEKNLGHSNAYRLLCGLSSHDFSALRGLIGKPQRVSAASYGARGGYISVLLDYGTFTATYEVGVDQTGVFDAFIELHAGGQRLRLDYDTPYIRQLPARLTVTSTVGGQTQVTCQGPRYSDPYTNQWNAFHDAQTNQHPISTTLEDAACDIDLAIEIIRALVATPSG